MKIERLHSCWALSSPDLVARYDLAGGHGHPCTTQFKVVALPPDILLLEPSPLTSSLLHHPLLTSQPGILLDLRRHHPLSQLNLLFLAGVPLLEHVMIEPPPL